MMHFYFLLIRTKYFYLKLTKIKQFLALLIVDPIVSAVATDSHKNGEVRRGLQPLVDLAAAQGCALLGITHYSKGTAGRDPLERVTGSVAFGALARLVFGTAKPTEEGAPRRMVRAKRIVRRVTAETRGLPAKTPPRTQPPAS